MEACFRGDVWDRLTGAREKAQGPSHDQPTLEVPYGCSVVCCKYFYWVRWWKRRRRDEYACKSAVYKYACDGGGGRGDVYVSGGGEFAGQERGCVHAEQRAGGGDACGEHDYVDADACGVAGGECVYGDGDDAVGGKRDAELERDAEWNGEYCGGDHVLDDEWH